MNDRTRELIAAGKRMGGTAGELATALERYQRRVIAHHELGTLSHEVLREWDGGPCPICARADTGIV